MVEELRKIILTKEEIFAAIDSFRRANPDFLPNGDFVNCQAEKDGNITLIVKLAYGKKNQNMEFNFTLADLLGPIVQFCVENNIVLPRNSRKCVKMEGDKIALYIAMETPQTNIPAPPPQAMAKSAKTDPVVRN